MNSLKPVELSMRIKSEFILIFFFACIIITISMLNVGAMLKIVNVENFKSLFYSELFWLIGSLNVLLIFLVSWSIYSFLNPIKEIRKALLNKLNHVDGFGLNTLSGIASSVNQLVKKMETYEDSLLQNKITLEQNILERTKELQAQKHKTEKIADSTPVLIAYIDKDLIYRFVNKNYETWFNIPKEKIINKHVDDILTKEFDDFSEEFTNVLSGHSVHKEKHIHLQGIKKFVRINFTPDFKGKNDKNVIGFFACIEDITLLKQSENELKSKNEFLEFIITATSDAVWDWNLDENTEWYSPRFYQMLGYTKSHVHKIKKAWLELIHIDDREKAYKTYNSHLIDNKPFSFTVKYTHKDGTYIWGYCRGHAVKDSKGKIIRVSGTITDVTQLKEAEIKSEASNLAKTNFLANMSHEIRTPMNGIIGYKELLEQSLLTPKQSEMLNGIGSCANTMMTLVNDILDFAKIDSGEIKLHKKPFDLKNLVESSIEILNFKAKEKSLPLDFFYHDKVPTVFKGDPERIKQVIINILGNAIKFTEKGSIHVSVSGIKKEKKWHLAIKVKDSGIGIPQKNQKNIFERFNRGDHSISKDYEGTGLGLAICKKITDMMGGEIKVKSKPKLGSTFSIHIPLEEGRKALIRDIKSIENSDEKAIRVLIIEDNLINQKIAAGILENLGCNIEVANNGLEALNKIKNENEEYSIIFMDCHMPEMDGYETTQKIREHEKNSIKYSTPIIALTANTLDEDKDKCLKAGMNDYLSKPISLNDMERILGKWAK